ncbi:unnamed protein product [Prorocentrum cordatum]|uniref:Uncharacterized protein n=1 Tax=Prorocentrum cordatum TaxID=2364126 RepID=A0ABN9WP12_9DINO|nr:unnamed protein product [Polarella glacialis]
MGFGTLLFSIVTSFASMTLTVLDIRTMAKEQDIGFWRALVEQLLVGLGRTAPLCHIPKLQADVDYEPEGELAADNFKQIASSASNSKALETMQFYCQCNRLIEDVPSQIHR